MTLELAGSWTSTSAHAGNREPFAGYALGIAPLIAIPLYTGAVAIAGALGYGTYQSVFGNDQRTFDEGWYNVQTFDQRMAALHALWLKFDQTIQLRCPSFVTKDAGKWWRSFKSDLNGFGKFYGRVGQRSGTFNWKPTPEIIGEAQGQLSSLIGWGQTVEQQCPGTFPNLGILAPSEAEQVAEKKRIEDAGKDNDFFSNFGTSLGLTLGVAAIGLAGFFYLTRPRAPGFGDLQAMRTRVRSQTKSRKSKLVSTREILRAVREGGFSYDINDETSRCRTLGAARKARKMAETSPDQEMRSQLLMVARDAEFQIDRTRLPGQRC